MKTFFVGIDISKATLDAAICDQSTMDILLCFQCDNTVDGIEMLMQKCNQCIGKYKSWYCFEHTGNYGLLLGSILEEHSIIYSAVPALEIKQSIGMTRGKNDKIDAIRIAKYAAANQFKLSKTQLPGKSILKVKALLTYRSQLVKLRTQLTNSRKSFIVMSRSLDVKTILDDQHKQIEELTQRIDKAEKDIKAQIAADKQLSKSFSQIISVKGVGLMIAATMIVCTNNFQAFNDPRKFNCYAGIAPFEHSSGSSIHGRTKTSSLGNRTIKTLLFNGANTAANHDLELKAYYKRKKAEGKHHKTIMNAVACKIVSRIFAVVKRDQPYVNLVR